MNESSERRLLDTYEKLYYLELDCKEKLFARVPALLLLRSSCCQETKSSECLRYYLTNWALHQKALVSISIIRSVTGTTTSELRMR